MKVYALCMMLFTAISMYGQDNVIDEVVWVVGDEAILKSDVESARMAALQEGRKFDGDPYCIIPEELAVQKLFLHQAAIDSITVSEQDVINGVERHISFLIDRIGSREKLEEYYNQSYTQIREVLREDIRNNETVRMMKHHLAGKIRVVPADVRRFFKDLPSDSIPFIPTQVEVQVVTLEPVIPQAEIERVKKTLRDFTKQIEKGDLTFSNVALLYSQDPGSARNGGEYPFTGKGQLTPEFANVIFNMTDPKKISKVFKTEYGYHIAQLIEKRGDRVRYRHILIKPEVDEKELEKSTLRLDSIANDIRNQKFSFDEAATFISQDKSTKNNHGVMVNPENGTARFEMQQLAQVSQEVAKMVEGLKVGEISDPFVMLNRQGQEVVSIVKLKARIDGHKATISEDYQRLKAIVQEKLTAEKLDKWVREKQKHTYVRINKNWRKCDFRYPGWVLEEDQK